MNENSKKILLHTCCAICSAHPIKFLQELGYEPVAYFFNPNIYPESEYVKRLEAQKTLCAALNCELIIENYEKNFYDELMVGFENHKEGSERCSRCFEFRLLKSIQKADELGIENYTTSIPISPHKNFKLITNIGKKFTKYFKVNYLDIDFKKKDGLLKTNKIAKELGLYRQNYCGCQNSMRQEQN